MRRWSVGLLGWLLLSGTPFPASAGQSQASPSCVVRGLAIAHFAGGVVLHPQPDDAPLACGGPTGFGGSESRVGVTNHGTVVYEPAVLPEGVAGTGYLPGAPGPRPETQFSPGVLAFSNDDGISWYLVAPDGRSWTPQDDQLYIDRTTGRIFWYALEPNPFPQGVNPVDQLPLGEANLLMSPDDGGTWHHAILPGYVASENPRFAAAPPPEGQPKPDHYPNVVYWCGNNALFVYGARECWRSMDGGVTWDFASILFSRGIPQHLECGANEEQFGALDGNYPQPAPDGSLYVMVVCGGTTFLARSRDEGTTWPIIRTRSGTPLTIPAADELRIDHAGNLYAVRQRDDQLLLRVSRDHGRTWSRALDMTAPGVVAVAQWFVSVRGHGRVAVSYLGQRKSADGFDGYLTLTRNALAPRPLFWSAAVNDPKHRLTTDEGMTPAKDDFIGVDIGPDGNAWGAFYEDCEGETKPGCSEGMGLDFEADRGFVGELFWPGRLSIPDPAPSMATQGRS